MKSISGRKNEQQQEAVLTVAPKQGDVYYGYFIQNDASGKGHAKMLWTWLRIDKIEGKTYRVALNKEKTERQTTRDKLGDGFDLPVPASFTPGAIPSFKSTNNSFNFFAKRKQ